MAEAGEGLQGREHIRMHGVLKEQRRKDLNPNKKGGGCSITSPDSGLLVPDSSWAPCHTRSLDPMRLADI